MHLFYKDILLPFTQRLIFRQIQITIANTPELFMSMVGNFHLNWAINDIKTPRYCNVQTNNVSCRLVWEGEILVMWFTGITKCKPEIFRIYNCFIRSVLFACGYECFIYIQFVLYDIALVIRICNCYPQELSPV